MRKDLYMKIIYTHLDETLDYAIAELTKYISRMSDHSVAVETMHTPTMPERSPEGVIRLGLLAEFGLDTSEVADDVTDDVIDIDVANLTGYIAGSNIRSILLGVYRFLHSAGARWVRPGIDGEVIPKCDLTLHSFKYHHAATYRFRGECIEGAVSYENVRDTIEWLPKVGGNMFFLEQIIPYNYISRWYDREYNPKMPSDKRTFEMVGEYTRRLELLTKKCGLQLHSLGHGFMLEPYGIHYKTWRDEYDLSDYGRSHTALVNGERGLFHGSPNFTQLCFSNEDARRGMVDFLVDYIDKKPYIDFLHVWLADANNNHCECEECQKTTPSDFYVKILNELDEKLTARGHDNRIVFILYNDTVFPPEVEKIINQKRFILLTAFSRSYSEPMSPKEYKGKLPEFVRNKFNIPKDFGVNYAFLNKWREDFDGDAFIYEYYFYTDHYSDPGYTALSDVIVKDVRALKSLGFQGIVSDQTQRSFYPNGLPVSIMFEALYDEDLDESAYTDDYFKSAYGENYEAAKAYLTRISQLFNPNELRSTMSVVDEDTGLTTVKQVNLWRDNPDAAKRFAEIPTLCESFRNVALESASSATDLCRKKSWDYLVLHTQYATMLANAFESGANGDMDGAIAKYNALLNVMYGDEDKWQNDYDLCLYRQFMGAKFRK